MWQRPQKLGPGFPVHVLSSIVFHLHYCSQDDKIVMLDKITKKIDDISSDHSSASIHICGDFNIH